MTKTVFIAATALVATFLTTPETAGAGVLRMAGAKIAVTSAGQSYDITAIANEETDRRLGFGVAGFIEWFDLPVFSVVTQLEYLQRGMEQEFNVTSPESPEVLGTTTIENRLDYLSLPILAKGRIELGSVTPYALAGIRFDHLLGYESEGNFFNAVYDSFDRTTIGGSVGAGVELPELLPFGVLAELRYNFDLDDAYSTDLLTVSNNAYDLWIGITF
jgi:hypothetical protein